jgi:hypothetical protein
MMVREVLLDGAEQFLLRVARELRPALAGGDPPMAVPNRGQLPTTLAAQRHLMLRPTENVCICDPDVHAGEDAGRPLSIRFQIVAGHHHG